MQVGRVIDHNQAELMVFLNTPTAGTQPDLDQEEVFSEDGTLILWREATTLLGHGQPFFRAVSQRWPLIV